MPLAAALAMAEFTTAPELLIWPTNDFTCSSNSLPMSKGLPLDFSDSTDTVSGLPSLWRESNLFWYVVTQLRTVLSFKSSSCVLLKCLSDALTPFSAAYLATYAFNSSEIVAQLPCFIPADATFSISLWAAGKANTGTAAEELLPASLVGLKKCSSVDISLQSLRYVSPKHNTRQLSISHGSR